MMQTTAAEILNPTVDVLATKGSVENLNLLRDQKSGVEAGIVQGGVSNGIQDPEVWSLGRVNYQIFWFFYRGGAKLETISQLKGKRIAVRLLAGEPFTRAKPFCTAGFYDDSAQAFTQRDQSYEQAIRSSGTEVPGGGFIAVQVGPERRLLRGSNTSGIGGKAESVCLALQMTLMNHKRK